jgi:hypothetical protein
MRNGNSGRSSKVVSPGGSARGCRCRRVVLGVAVACALAVLVAAPAGAGVYHVYSCRTPAGAVAPTSGWGGSTDGPFMYDPNSCASGGSLTGELGGEVAHPANASDAGWIFSAPAGTQIAAARLWRSSYSRSWEPGNNSTVAWLAAPEDSYTSADVFDQCAAYAGCPEVGDPNVPMAQVNLVEVPPGNASGATHIYMNAACGGSNGTSCPAVGAGYGVAISLYAADITLADDTPPTASNVGGSLAAGGTLSGVGDISFSAADTGSGLYEAVFSIDGHAVSTQLLQSGSGPCRSVGGTSDGSNAFFEVEPCPLALSDDLSFNTALAPNGSHLLSVQLLDAAGNATTILNRQVTFANSAAGAPAGGAIGPGSPLAERGAANGVNASDQAVLTARWKSTAKAERTGGYGTKEEITGRLTAPGGVPITGASLGVYETPSYEGARTVPLARTSTGPTGAWTVTLPRHASSCALRFEYRSHVNDTIPVTTAALTLRVHAGVALKIAPRISSVGGTIAFSGTLHGTPIPPGGKQLVLEASSSREWIEFRTIATTPKGRFHASYRFKFPGPIVYRFRVLSPSEADFPFLAGTSNVVGVYER